MKIAISQINPIIGDVDYNYDRIIFFTDQARKQACDLVVFSELAVIGYPPRDLLEKDEFIDANIACLSVIAEFACCCAAAGEQAGHVAVGAAVDQRDSVFQGFNVD